MAFPFTSPSPQFSNPQAQQQPVLPQSTLFSSFLQQPQQQPQSQPQQPPPQLYLYTVDKSPAGYSTKWAELHPDSQKLLLQIEERILEYKDESQRLDQCNRLYDSSVSSDSFELDASHIMQELGVISTSMEREKVSVQELMNEANNMLWNTEVAVRSYMMLRPRFLHPNVSATSNIVPASQTIGATNSGYTNQPASGSMVAVYDFYSGIPKRPSLFLQHTVSRFEKYFTECCQWIEELEQLILMDTTKTSSSSGSLQSLPNIMTNVHDFFVHVAAKVESLHQYIESMKTAYLADQRRHGDGNDPFLEAERRQIAKQEAAARRVHPTLHLPPATQPSTQGTGLFAISGVPESNGPQQSVGGSGASSGSGFSIYSTPSAAAAASTSLFSTPSTSASASTLFGFTGFSPQSTGFGPAPTSLGSTHTPSLIGASTPSVASTPAIGTSTLFSTPSFISGGAAGAMGSGSSFGAASNKSRAKPRSSARR